MRCFNSIRVIAAELCDRCNVVHACDAGVPSYKCIAVVNPTHHNAAVCISLLDSKSKLAFCAVHSLLSCSVLILQVVPRNDNKFSNKSFSAASPRLWKDLPPRL